MSMSAAASPTLDSLLPELATARAEGLRAQVSTLFGLRRVDLLRREPDEVDRLAALRMEARVLRRVITPERRYMRRRTAEEHPREVPQPAAFEDALVTVVRAVGDEGPCPDCRAQGVVPCVGCGGTGKVDLPYRGRSGLRTIELGPPEGPCPSCDGSGATDCPTCERARVSAPVDALRVADRAAAVEHLYAPALSLTELERFDGIVCAGPAPDALSVGLEPRREGVTYRDAPVGFTIRGFDYSAAIPLAQGAAAGLGGEGEVVRSERSLTAWPFLLLRFGERRLVLLRDAAGRHHAIV